jgi:hypothetical protein
MLDRKGQIGQHVGFGISEEGCYPWEGRLEHSQGMLDGGTGGLRRGLQEDGLEHRQHGRGMLLGHAGRCTPKE